MNDGTQPLNEVLKPLTFKEFSKQNLSRACRWHDGTLATWTIPEWGCAFMGEAGEVGDAIKKWTRLRTNVHSNNVTQPADLKTAEDKILKEIGDAVSYADLLAQRMGSDLETCLRKVFNAISERENMPERI